MVRCPQEGGTATLATDRTPDFFRRASPFGESWVLAVEGSGAALAATVTLAIKSVWVADRQVVAGYVFDLAVDPSERGRGLAGRLLREAEEIAVAAGADFVYAHVMRGNAASRSTFDRAGYEQRATMIARVVVVDGEPEPQSGTAPESPTDWEAAVAAFAVAEKDHDLARGHDAASLRAEWTGLPGWRGSDTWQAGGSVIGLWDYGAVARFLPVVSGADDGRDRQDALHAGLILGGVGDGATLARLFGSVIRRAAAHGMHGVFTGFDERAEPDWFGERLTVDEPYCVFVRTLRGGPAERLGERPLRVDPIDL